MVVGGISTRKNYIVLLYFIVFFGELHRAFLSLHIVSLTFDLVINQGLAGQDMKFLTPANMSQH